MCLEITLDTTVAKETTTSTETVETTMVIGITYMKKVESNSKMNALYMVVTNRVIAVPDLTTKKDDKK